MIALAVIGVMVMIKRMDNCVVILDRDTKTLVENVAYMDLSNNATILTDINELNGSFTKMPVVLFESILLSTATLTMLRELKYKYEFNFILLYNDDNIAKIASSVCTLYKCDYSNIDINLIYSVVMKDSIVYENYSKVVKHIDAFQHTYSTLPKEHKELFRTLYTDLIDIVGHHNSMLKQIQDLEHQLNVSEAEFARIKKGIIELNNYYDEIHDNVTEYETRLTSSYDKPVSGDYPDKPKILYLKEQQHLPGCDILLNTLYFVLTTQFNTSCKIVKLVDSSNAKGTRYLPDSYAIMQNVYNNKDVLSEDFILKRGPYDRVFDLLLLNRAQLRYLIVHDMRGTSSLALDESLIRSTVHIVSSEYKQFFQSESILTENKKAGDLFWNNEIYRNIPVEKRLVALSAHPTVKKLLDKLM